jgi:BirA family biotin operon repressor/biotin-[acetyl-CoA-carboxylase] ligase
MAWAKNDKLDGDKLKPNTKRIGNKILVYSSTSSTNALAAKYARDKGNNGLAIFAEQQTNGRGRAGNKWLSGEADSILCSIVLTDSKLNSELLSLTCAVAAAEAIGGNVKIKWPNDITLNGKKTAGILLESKKAHGKSTYIIGIGINCHQTKESFPAELQLTATSIDIESGTTCDRNLLAKRLLTSLDHWLEIAESNSEKVTEQWRNLSSLLNQRITLIFNGTEFTGNCTGIDPERGLCLQLDTGGVRMFDAAHTSIVK